MSQNINNIVESLYAEVRGEFERSDTPLVRPVSQNGAVGFAVLYTEPRVEPGILIVGQNPGNFGPNDRVWDDEPNRIMMSGQVPTSNSYIVHDHNFAKQLRRHFAGSDRPLLETCVGMNVWFVQARGTPAIEPALAAFCEDMSHRIIRAIRPRTILCLSQQAFETLATGPVSTFGDEEAPCKLSTSDSIPMLYAHHPTGRWTRQQAAISIPAAIAHIKAILSGAASPAMSATLPAPRKGGELRPAPRTIVPGAHDSTQRSFRITAKGRAFLTHPGRAKQLAVIVELLDKLGGPNSNSVDEGTLVKRMAEHQIIRSSRQTPQALLDWYRTHRLIPDELALVSP